VQGIETTTASPFLLLLVVPVAAICTPFSEPMLFRNDPFAMAVTGDRGKLCESHRLRDMLKQRAGVKAAIELTGLKMIPRPVPEGPKGIYLFPVSASVSDFRSMPCMGMWTATIHSCLDTVV
jgi:hypothetical protein